MGAQAVSVIDALILGFCVDGCLGSFNGVSGAMAIAIGSGWAMKNLD